MGDPESSEEQSRTGFTLQKGSCLECKCYRHCPRMRGITHCQNMQWVPTDPGPQPATGIEKLADKSDPLF
ncbi:MAG: hypothetical protein P4L50_10555 [Anaerolineaceae bacterium]|nr:hypothetical protein [Anaerolineaceae bacterium]